jgi:hypothetical protein
MLILLGGLSGCSLFAASNAPIDCDVVKTQERAGQNDTQIASNLGAPVDKVNACHGPEVAGNKSEDNIPSNY